MGEPVFDLELQEVKKALRGLGTTFEARIFRPTTIVDDEVPKVDPVEAKPPVRRRNSIIAKVKPLSAPKEGNNVEPRPIDRVFIRNGKPIKCSNSVYCPCCTASRDASRILEMEKINSRVTRRLKSMRKGNTKKTATLNPTFDSNA